MAKSLRSKWRRKCRAVKRIRYGQKELERLKKTVGIDDTNNEVKMEKDLLTVVNETAKNSAGTSKVNPNEDTMETDVTKQILNPKTLRNDSGTYPVWMHQRKIKAIKRGAKLAKHKKK